MSFGRGAVLSLFRKPVVRFFTLGILAVLAALTGISRLGVWLLVSDTPPADLDVIGTFAGERRRVDYSRELMGRYPDAHWFLSDYKNGHGRILQKTSFDMSRVSIVDTCKSTISEITALREWIDSTVSARRTAPGTQLHLGLVSSPYHMRRIRIMAGRRLKIKNVKFHFLPVPLETYGWTKDSFRFWWRSNAIASITCLKYN